MYYGKLQVKEKQIVTILNCIISMDSKKLKQNSSININHDNILEKKNSESKELLNDNKNIITDTDNNSNFNKSDKNDNENTITNDECQHYILEKQLNEKINKTTQENLTTSNENMSIENHTNSEFGALGAHQIPENPFRYSTDNNDIILKPGNLESDIFEDRNKVQNWDIINYTENKPTNKYLSTDANYDTVNVKGTSNHIGSKIIATSVTIVNNNSPSDMNLRKKDTNVKSNKSNVTIYLCNKIKKYVPILMLVVIMLLLIIVNIFNQLAMTNKGQFLDETEIKTEEEMKTSTERNFTEEQITSSTERNHIQEQTKSSTERNYILPEPLLINRTSWNALTYENDSQYCFPPRNILTIMISQLKNDSCYDINTCSYIIKKIEKENYNKTHLDMKKINYNFLIGGDGRIYEGRGWNCKSDTFSVYSSFRLSIAFIGDYSCTNQNESLSRLLYLQWNSFKTLIDKNTKEENNLKTDHDKEKIILLNYVIMPRCCVSSLTDNINNPGGKLINLMKQDDHYTKVDCFLRKGTKCKDLC